MSTLKERLESWPAARCRKVRRRYRRLKAEQMQLDELRRGLATARQDRRGAREQKGRAAGIGAQSGLRWRRESRDGTQDLYRPRALG
jgi:hypothetical protein